MTPFSSSPEEPAEAASSQASEQPLQTFEVLKALAPGTLIEIKWKGERGPEIFKILPPDWEGQVAVLMTSEAHDVEGENFRGSVVTIVDSRYFGYLQAADASMVVVPLERAEALLSGGLQFCDDLDREKEKRASAWKNRLGTGQ